MNDERINKLGSLTKEQLQLLIKRRAGKGLNKKTPMLRMPRNDTEEFPLSNSQERFWFLEQLNKGIALYNNPVYSLVEVTESVNPVIMEKALTEVVIRHEILRTTFHHNQGILTQKVHESIPVRLKYEDISDLSEEDKDVYMEETALAEVSQNYKLDEAPLWRLRILKVSSKKQLFLFTPHHIISDGWSNAIFLRELIMAYSNIQKVGYYSSNDYPYQYVDYVNWEQKWYDSADYKKSLSYWKNLLSPLPDNINLPIDVDRPPVITGNGKMINSWLSKSETQKIEQFSKSKNITTFHALYTALSILLYRYSQQNEIVIGVPVANRNKKEFQNIVGLFLNTIPFKTTINHSITFNELVQHVKTQTESNLLHQHMPLDKILSVLNVEQRLEITPLFQVLFVFQNIPSLYSMGDVKLNPYKIDIGYTKNDLNFWVELYDEEYLITLFANTDIFSENKIERILQHFKNIIPQLIEHPDLPISEIEFITDYEKKIIFNSSATVKIIENFKDRFEANLSTCNNDIAIQHNDEKLTYNELNSRANRLSNYVISKNPASAPIAILLSRGVNMIISLLAVIKSGDPYVPIDPNLPDIRIQYILNDCKANLIISETEHQHKLSAGSLQPVYLDRDEQYITKFQDKSPDSNISPHDPVYIIYTSGTTGNPKGVSIPHSSLINYTDSVTKRIGFDARSSYAIVSTIAADLGNTMIFPALLNSGSIIITPEEALFSSELLADYFQKLAPDYLKIVPSHMNALLTNNKNVLPNKALVLGGEETDTKLLARIREMSPDLDIYNHYGPTESTVGVTTYKIKGNEEVIPIGKPLENCTVYILDSNLKPVPPGVEGEIYIGGQSLAKEYLNSKELTDERFVLNPFRSYFSDVSAKSDSDRLFKTNDKGLLREDGNILFRGRYDRQIKYNGHRIELKEIEAHLLKHREIDQAIILVPDDNTHGQLWAVVTVNTEFNESRIKEKLANTLPNHMIPNRIFKFNNIPVTLNGKVDYEKVLTLAQKSIATGLTNHIPVKLTKTEQKLSDIFCRILKIDNPDINSSFFDLGGSSISSIELLYNINELFNSELSVAFIFNFSSIKRIAKELNSKFNFSNIVKIKNGNSNRSLFLVHPAGGNIFCYNQMAAHITPELNVYGIQTDFSKADNDSSINTLATNYLTEIKKLELNDEYIIGGWSMGALVAHEMAVLHRNQTGKLSKVLIIDQLAYQDVDKNSKPDDIDRMVIFSKKVEHLVGDKLDINHDNLTGITDDERSVIFLEKFKQHRLAPENIRPSDFKGFLEKMLHHNDISMQHIPSAYEGEVVLVVAENPLILDGDETTYGENRPMDLLWNKFSEHLTIISSPGNHASIMRSPNVDAMAKKLQKVLVL
jgi:amino acid adenylation domain-containing protein